MGITFTTTLPAPKPSQHGSFQNCLSQGQHHYGRGGHNGGGQVHGGGHVGGGHGKGHHPYGAVGPVVSQPPKHQPHHGVAGPVVSQPPKHPPHHGVAGPVVSQPPKHPPHHGVAGPVVCQPPKHPPHVGGGGGVEHKPPAPMPPKHPPHHVGGGGGVEHKPPAPMQPKHPPHHVGGGGGVEHKPPASHPPKHPSNEDIYKHSNKFDVGFDKHEYKGKHDKYDVAHFDGPRSQYKFDYAGDNKVSVTDLESGKKTRLDNIEAVTFGKSVQDTKPGDKSYGYDKEQFYRLAIDGKGIGEGRFKDIRPDTNMLNSTKPNADGSTNVTTGSGNDLLRGTGGDDKLNGGKGNDIFWGGTGDDKINGGKGFDTAAYQRNRDDYTIWKDDHGRIHIKDKTRNTGEDVLSSIENMRFANGNFDVKHLKFDAPPGKHPAGEAGWGGGEGGSWGKGYSAASAEYSSEANMIEEYIDWV